MSFQVRSCFEVGQTLALKIGYIRLIGQAQASSLERKPGSSQS